jgi:4-aminobutyrate aminotransferase-like enzyme
MFDVEPDIVLLGKPMGNGHPVSAVVTTQEIAESFSNGMDYFNTFGGNPVSCAIAYETIQILKEEGMREHSYEMGEYFMNRIRAEDHPMIGDIRGRGLFLGVEIVKDKKTKEPAGDELYEVILEMKRRGILIGSDGPNNNVIKFKPPLTIQKRDIDKIIDTFFACMKDLYGK